MDKFDIIVIAGQSNAQGMGVGEVKNEYNPTPDIWQLEQPKTVEHRSDAAVVTFTGSPQLSIADEILNNNKEKVGNFAFSFARNYIEKGLLQDRRKVLIVRSGIGGTGFKKGHWGLKDAVYLKTLELIDYALALNPENKLKAFLWHQGEHDAFEKNDSDVFEKQLLGMVMSVRERYKTPTLPFIAADFVHDWKNKNLSDCAPIVEKIRKVIQQIDNAAFVETGGLLSNDEKNANGDDIHFCREALYELGERYFQAFLGIKGEK